MIIFNLACTFLTQLVLIVAFVGRPLAADRVIATRDQAQVIRAYLRANYARDFSEAYRLISAEDHKSRTLDRYVRQRGPFTGFTLEVAKKLSESIEITVLGQQKTANRTQVVIRYRVPDPRKIAPLVLNWDSYRLNGLSVGERREILDTLQEKQHARAIEMSEGEEKFDLVKEGDEWRVFLDWSAGIKIPLRLDLAQAPELDVTLAEQEFVLQPGELFEVSLKIRNKTLRVVTTRIAHSIEPQAVADYLDFVQCGFLLPVTIEPGKEQEFSGTYLLRGNLPEGMRRLNLTYEFRVLK